MRRHAFGLAAGALSFALALTGLAPAVAASDTAEEQVEISSLRQRTVDRAREALTSPRTYRLSETGDNRRSSPVGGRHPHNTLGTGTSNANINVYTGFRSEDWCGDFAAAIWTGHNKPDPDHFPRIPRNYASSQAWRTETGSNYHDFSADRMPRPGDVVVWQSEESPSHGHVGVVTVVDTDARRIHTIEGNVDGEDIARKIFDWTRAGLRRGDLRVTGFTSRE